MAARTPSPGPAPPLSQQPGPRASRLTSLLSSAVSHTAGALTYRHFASCFPTPATHSASALEGFHRDVTSRLGEMCNFELESLFKDRDVVTSLNELDDALAKARRAREQFLATSQGEPREFEEANAPVAPHTLPAEAILAAHMSDYLRDETAGLEERLANVQLDNLKEADAIRLQRRQMEEMVSNLEALVADLEEAAHSIPSDVASLVEANVVTGS